MNICGKVKYVVPDAEVACHVLVYVRDVWLANRGEGLRDGVDRRWWWWCRKGRVRRRASVMMAL